MEIIGPFDVKTNPPLVEGDYLAWSDPNYYMFAAGWQRMQYFNNKWTLFFGGLNMQAYPIMWAHLPPDPFFVEKEQ